MTTKNEKNYVIFSRFGNNGENQYMTEEKPYHVFKSVNPIDAKFFTVKQASKIVKSLNQDARRSSYCMAVYGYTMMQKSL
jgi:hypothetical protein